MNKNKKVKFYYKIFFASFSLFLVTRTLVSSVNVSLSVQYQNNQEKIVELNNTIENLDRQLQSLKSYDRISSVALDEEMSPNFEGVVLSSNSEE